jgi:hypothetical protein
MNSPKSMISPTIHKITRKHDDKRGLHPAQWNQITPRSLQ